MLIVVVLLQNVEKANLLRNVLIVLGMNAVVGLQLINGQSKSDTIGQ